MNESRSENTAREADLVARLAALPREIEPAHELWPAIRARIAPPARSARGGMLARAAGLLLPVLGALLVGALLGYGYGTRGATHGAAPLAHPTEDGGIEHIELAFAGARESYLREIALADGRLDDPGRAALRSQLAVIDQAVHELREALAKDPANPLYLDTLLMTREREIELLADIRGSTYTRL